MEKLTNVLDFLLSMLTKLKNSAAFELLRAISYIVASIIMFMILFFDKNITNYDVVVFIFVSFIFFSREDEKRTK